MQRWTGIACRTVDILEAVKAGLLGLPELTMTGAALSKCTRRNCSRIAASQERLKQRVSGRHATDVLSGTRRRLWIALGSLVAEQSDEYC